MPFINAWRATHFARMRASGSQREVSEQSDLSTAAWAVYVDEGDLPLAAIGFRDDPQSKERLVTDLYATSARGGLRAGALLGAMVERMSDEDGYEIRGSTDPENTDYLQHLLGRGFEITAIQFRRKARGKLEQRAAAERSGERADRRQHEDGADEPRAVACPEPFDSEPSPAGY